MKIALSWLLACAALVLLMCEPADALTLQNWLLTFALTKGASVACGYLSYKLAKSAKLC